MLVQPPSSTFVQETMLTLSKKTGHVFLKEVTEEKDTDSFLH